MWFKKYMYVFILTTIKVYQYLYISILISSTNKIN